MNNYKFQIWYMKPEWFRDGILGKKPNAYKLDDTHVHLKDIEVEGKNYESALERVFMTMQGEIWSPNGEARGLIMEKGLQHTSMSVGDVAVADDSGEVFLVKSVGFECILREGEEGHDFEDDGRSQEAANDRYASRSFKD